MNSYTVRVKGINLEVKGDNLVDALQPRFQEIAKLAEIGNPAGYQLDDVRLIPGPNAGEMLFQVTAHGSDLLCNYDPRADKPRTFGFPVTGVPEEERFETVVELSPVSDDFDPFADLSGKPDDYRLGVAMGLFDEVSVHRCRMPENGLPISVSLGSTYPTLLTANPTAALNLITRRLNQRHPYDDADTVQMIARAQELFRSCNPKPLSAWFWTRVKTTIWFERQGKQTALQHLRIVKGLTQQQLADSVGISCRQIQNYEQLNSRLCDAKYSVVVAISEAVGCKPSDLVQDGQTVLIPKAE